MGIRVRVNIKLKVRFRVRNKANGIRQNETTPNDQTQ